ncbi:MAG: septum formation inhibitor Maf [Lachnospiraceae bacterium]|nr:septum formation inhibitor Maf [Lachnospiraceae bacterium]
MKKIILASKSPRRSELLRQIGLDFEVFTSEVDENIEVQSPEKLVMQLSRLKAVAVYEEYNLKEENLMVIGADTVVALNGQILGKPRDEKHAKEMLMTLSDNEHEVLTGVTIVTTNDGKPVIETFYEKTIVYTYPITENEINDYIMSREPMDKAGSYGIQGMGARFIKKIDGDYNNVVGLPISQIYQKIKEMQ